MQWSNIDQKKILISQTNIRYITKYFVNTALKCCLLCYNVKVIVPTVVV